MMTEVLTLVWTLEAKKQHKAETKVLETVDFPTQVTSATYRRSIDGKILMVLNGIGSQLSLYLSDYRQDPGLEIFVAVRSDHEIDLVGVWISRTLSSKSENCILGGKRNFVEDS